VDRNKNIFKNEILIFLKVTMNQLKKSVYLIVFFGCNLGASDNDVSLGAERVEISSVVPQSQGFQFLELGRYSTIEGAPSFDDCKSKCVEGCQSKWVQRGVAFTICAALGFGFGFGYAPYTYRVYNRDSDSIYLYYRPGCTQKSGDSTKTVDCVKHIYSGKHAVMYSAGHLTKLCARDDWNNYWSQNCATYNGVQNDLTWNVHNHDGELYFGRGQYPSSEEINNTTGSDVMFGFYNSSDVTSEFTKVNFSGSMQK